MTSWKNWVAAVMIAPGLVMIRCSTDHTHDGLYVANQSTSGVANAWILKGDELTTYSLGVVGVKRCRQSGDMLVVEGDTFQFNKLGDIVIRYDSVKGVDYHMRRVSDRTDYTFSELNKIVDEVYDNEGSGAPGKNETSGDPH